MLRQLFFALIASVVFAASLAHANEFNELLKKANDGSADAQLKIAVAYALGDGVTQDDAQAISWYRKAAEQGLAGAQLLLGGMYSEGRGVTQDDTQAISWIRNVVVK